MGKLYHIGVTIELVALRIAYTENMLIGN